MLDVMPAVSDPRLRHEAQRTVVEDMERIRRVVDDPACCAKE